LTNARKEAKGEWKVYLETILLELRDSNFETAMTETEKALEVCLSALFSYLFVDVILFTY
jgi:hypothetical protein